LVVRFCFEACLTRGMGASSVSSCENAPQECARRNRRARVTCAIKCETSHRAPIHLHERDRHVTAFGWAESRAQRRDHAARNGIAPWTEALWRAIEAIEAHWLPQNGGIKKNLPGWTGGPAWAACVSVPQALAACRRHPAALLPDDPIKAAARYTTKYLIFHLGAYPATPNASAHIVAPHTALGLRIRDTPIVACLVVVGAFRQTRCKA